MCEWDCYSVNPCKETYKLARAFALSRVTEILMQLMLQVENIFHIYEMRYNNKVNISFL